MDGAKFEHGVTLEGHVALFQGDGNPQTMVELVSEWTSCGIMTVTIADLAHLL